VCLGRGGENGVSIEEICNSQEEKIESGEIGIIGEGRASRRARIRVTTEARQRQEGAPR